MSKSEKIETTPEKSPEKTVKVRFKVMGYFNGGTHPAGTVLEVLEADAETLCKPTKGLPTRGGPNLSDREYEWTANVERVN
jgi:hypothetical protein